MSLMLQDLQRNSGSACGMVQSNYIGTEFTIYDRGMSGVTALSPKGVSNLLLILGISKGPVSRGLCLNAALSHLGLHMRPCMHAKQRGTELLNMKECCIMRPFQMCVCMQMCTLRWQLCAMM